MKKRKWMSIVLAMTLSAVLFAGCGNESGNDPTGSNEGGETADSTKAGTPDTKTNGGTEEITLNEEGFRENGTWKVAYFTATSEGEYWQTMEQGFQEGVGKRGFEMEIISADNDAVRQVEQIETAIGQDYDVMMVFAVDPDSVKDVCKRAMDNDILVYTFIKDTGEGYRTSCYKADEKGMGKEVVLYAADWAAENWDKETLNVLIIGGSSAGSETDRYEGMCEAAAANAKFNVLEETRIETSQSAAQNATENYIAKYPDVDIILYGSVEMAVGGMTYIESEASPLKNYSDIALFAGGLSQEAADDIRRAASEEKNGVIKGVVNNGTGTHDENAAKFAAQWTKILMGQDYEPVMSPPYARVTVENLAEHGFPE